MIDNKSSSNNKNKKIKKLLLYCKRVIRKKLCLFNSIFALKSNNSLISFHRTNFIIIEILNLC